MNASQLKYGNGLKLIDLLRLSLRIFRTKPLRTFLTVLGMAFGIGAVLFLVSLGYGLQFTLLGRLMTTEDSLITLEAFYPSEAEINITNQDLEMISKIPEVAEISPVAEFTGELKYEGVTGLVIVRITNYNYFRLSGLEPDIGTAFLEFAPTIVISNLAAKIININAEEKEIGQDKKLSSKIFYQDEKSIEVEEANTKEPLILKGIVTDESSPPFIIVPENFIDKKPPFFKKVLVKAQDINAVEPLRDKLVEKGFLISARIDLINQATKLMRVITIVLGVFGITALVVAAVGMFNTMIVGFMERIAEVGIIKSLGATDVDVRNIFLMESFIMGFLGGACGIILGIGAGELANLGMNLLAKRFGGKSFDIFVTPFWFILLIIVSSSLIGLISGFWPARKASYLSPKEAFLRK